MKYLLIITCIALTGITQAQKSLSKFKRPVHEVFISHKAEAKVSTDAPLLKAKVKNRPDRFMMQKEAIVIVSDYHTSKSIAGLFFKGNFHRPKVKDITFHEGRNQISISVGKQFKINRSWLAGVDLGSILGFNYSFSKGRFIEIAPTQATYAGFSIVYFPI